MLKRVLIAVLNAMNELITLITGRYFQLNSSVYHFQFIYFQCLSYSIIDDDLKAWFICVYQVPRSAFVVFKATTFTVFFHMWANVSRCISLFFRNFFAVNRCQTRMCRSSYYYECRIRLNRENIKKVRKVGHKSTVLVACPNSKKSSDRIRYVLSSTPSQNRKLFLQSW